MAKKVCPNCGHELEVSKTDPQVLVCTECNRKFKVKAKSTSEPKESEQSQKEEVVSKPVAPANGMKTCPNCGHQDNGRFCPNCGTMLGGTATPVNEEKLPESPVKTPKTPITSTVSNMENVNNLIAAALLALLALLNVFTFLTNIRYLPAMSIITMIVAIAGYALAAVGLFKKDYPILTVAGFGALALLQIYSFISGFFYQSYSVWHTYSESFNLLCVLPALIKLIAFLAMFLIALSTLSPNKQMNLNVLWIIPAGALVASHIIGLFLALVLRNWTTRYGYINFRGILVMLLTAAAFLFAALWMARPSGNTNFVKKEAPVARNNASTASSNVKPVNTASAQSVNPKGYIGLLAHGLLLFFTFGIWYYVWIFRVTEFLNDTQGETPRSGVAQLLLCMFVPFYSIYWIYTSAQRIDKMAAQHGVVSDISMLCLLLAIFIGILPPFFMQEKINAIVTA